MKPMNAMPMKPKPTPMGQRMMGTPIPKPTAPAKQPPRMGVGPKQAPTPAKRAPERMQPNGTMPKQATPNKMSPKKSALMRAIKKG
jgi:hypothetical protein